MDDGGARSAAPSQKRPTLPPDGELAELLWRDGAVVARAHRHHHDQQGSSFGRVPSGVTWDAPASAAAATRDSGAPGGDVYAQLWRDVARLEGRAADGDTAASAWTPAARSSRTGGGEVGSSFCGSNAVTAAPALALLRVDDDTDDDAALPMLGASTSGRPGMTALLKRGRDDTDSRGEDADFQAVDDDETRPGSAKRRTRSAEVHNLSERRRRDRINDKVRALQELVPHCNKTDKASILDEAIEYLKSLQMQVQIMWMTTGVAPMMLPGTHRLMSPMGMGLNSTCMPPTTQVLSQMQRVSPFMNSPLPNHMPGVSSAATRVPNVAKQVQENRVAVPRNPFLHPNDAPAATHEMAHQNEIQELLASAAAPAMGVEQPFSSP